jgi:hypothetical protein
MTMMRHVIDHPTRALLLRAKFQFRIMNYEGESVKIDLNLLGDIFLLVALFQIKHLLVQI